MMSMLPKTDGAARARWLLLGSLALNLLLVGAAATLAFHSAVAVPLAPVGIHHSGVGQLETLAATLPTSDAQAIRSELYADAERVAAAQTDLRLAEEDLRNSLRADPFDPNAVQAAMVEVRTTREKFDLVLHDVIAAAAAKMSLMGRYKLADWPEKREDTMLR